jgi:hypothetical protein
MSRPSEGYAGCRLRFVRSGGMLPARVADYEEGVDSGLLWEIANAAMLSTESNRGNWTEPR